MINKERAIYLIEKSFSATLTEAEKADFEDWLISGANREEYVSLVTTLLLQHPETVAYNETYWQPVLDKVLEADRTKEAAPVRTLYSRFRNRIWAAAAVLAILLTGGLFLLVRNKPATSGLQVNLAKIAPGHKGALLTLANGKVVELDSLPNGVVATDKGTVITLQNGQLVYSNTADNKGEIAYNTISTPLGRQFELNLPDGSKVWLNAGSSLHYPVVFEGKDRRVEITGEAYFEVAAKAGVPFIVEAPGNNTIEVLGTEFNINAYANEAKAATTLISGAVRVNAGKQALQLQPGQQALVSAAKEVELNNHPDIAQVTAWKNGVFNFENQKLEVVMRQLARWYNIEVAYAGAVPNIEFFGEMGKNLNLLQVLQVLEKSGVKFTMNEDNKLIVMP
ncbi:FecR family protein [Filimonas lacunae]|uniref:FecR family protein n=1 Tax=Filimonas lacunae TaxID=477680 RepID=A0A173MMR0_9BACT|nr:FecR domain-containing protein [Filimonas lacunae]BAV08924.1 anti-sigma factor [Filimonas lacunae]SIS64096.1 FecR family protein [Filimonas lacunae]